MQGFAVGGSITSAKHLQSQLCALTTALRAGARQAVKTRIPVTVDITVGRALGGITLSYKQGRLAPSSLPDLEDKKKYHGLEVLFSQMVQVIGEQVSLPKADNAS